MGVRRAVVSAVLCWTVSATPADVVRVIDGDTFVARLGVYLNLSIEEHVRILGVDTPEVRAEPERAEAAKRFTTEWLKRDDFRLLVCRRDSFGRVLATVTRQGSSLAAELAGAGHVKRKDTP